MLTRLATGAIKRYSWVHPIEQLKEQQMELINDKNIPSNYKSIYMWRYDQLNKAEIDFYDPIYEVKGVRRTNKITGKTQIIKKKLLYPNREKVKK